MGVLILAAVPFWQAPSAPPLPSHTPGATLCGVSMDELDVERDVVAAKKTKHVPPVYPEAARVANKGGFLLYLIQERKVSFSTFNQALNAARFFFLDVLQRPFVVEGLRYQKPPRRLPVVMNEEEMSRLLAAGSLRDRALLETAYATGMRVGEVTRMLVTDLDSQRMVIRVEQGKGRKDRYVKLSPSLLETLRAYWREAKPKVFLFPGVGGNKPLCI